MTGFHMKKVGKYFKKNNRFEIYSFIFVILASEDNKEPKYLKFDKLEFKILPNLYFYQCAKIFTLIYLYAHHQF